MFILCFSINLPPCTNKVTLTLTSFCFTFLFIYAFFGQFASTFDHFVAKSNFMQDITVADGQRCVRCVLHDEPADIDVLDGVKAAIYDIWCRYDHRYLKSFFYKSKSSPRSMAHESKSNLQCLCGKIWPSLKFLVKSPKSLKKKS